MDQVELDAARVCLLWSKIWNGLLSIFSGSTRLL